MAPPRKKQRTSGIAEDVTPKPTMKVLDPDGDVIFLFRDDSRIKVFSKVMALASKAFKAMLSPTFLEGQSLNTDNPPVVELPDDDPKLMVAVCAILHHSMAAFPKSTPMGFLVEVFVLSDKYNCVSAVRHVLIALAWSTFQGHEAKRLAPTLSDRETPSFVNQIDFVILAYLLRDQLLFDAAIHQFVDCTKMLSTSLAISRPGSHLLPAALWITLTEKRQERRGEILQDIRAIAARGRAGHWRLWIGLIKSFADEKDEEDFGFWADVRDDFNGAARKNLEDVLNMCETVPRAEDSPSETYRGRMPNPPQFDNAHLVDAVAALVQNESDRLFQLPTLPEITLATFEALALMNNLRIKADEFNLVFGNYQLCLSCLRPAPFWPTSIQWYKDYCESCCLIDLAE